MSSECDAITSPEKLSWGDVDSDVELEQCLTTLANTLVTPQAMADWLTNQGFDVIPPYDGVSPVLHMVGARWNKSNHSSVKPYGNAISRTMEEIIEFFGSFAPFLMPPKEYLITISYHSNGYVEVDAGPLSL